jgi:hypothetical protein
VWRSQLLKAVTVTVKKIDAVILTILLTLFP